MPPRYADLSAEMRAHPVTIDHVNAAGIENAIANAVERCSSRKELVELEAELVHIVALTLVRMTIADHEGKPCAACLTRLSYSFDRTISQTLDAIAVRMSGGLH